MAYIDGFVIAVPQSNRQKFIAHARTGDSVFLELGATRILECWGDDVPTGKITDFARAVQAKEDEAVVFSWVEWPDKSVRDAAMARMEELMKTDPRMNPEKNPMPFDGMRMIYGGFSPVVVMEKPQMNKPGDFIWYELLTNDAAASEAFYEGVLGWRIVDSGHTEMDYRIINAQENAVGGLMPINHEMDQNGARPTWLGYIAVDDVDAAVADIGVMGGRVLMPAMDIAMVGRIAMVADPQGAPFYVMRPMGGGKSLAFSEDFPRPGHCAWNELHTPDQPGSWTFYSGLFGWKQDGEMDLGPMGPYQLIRHGGMIGAMMSTDPVNHAAAWHQYFRVVDIDAAKADIERLGGRVVQGPDEIPGGDYSMNCIDPQGAAFGLVGGREV